MIELDAGGKPRHLFIAQNSTTYTINYNIVTLALFDLNFIIRFNIISLIC